MTTNNNFSFCVAGCLHFGGPMRLWNSYKDTYHLMNDMALLKPDMLFLNGSDVDLALRNSDVIRLTGHKKNLISLTVQSEDYVNFTRSVMDSWTAKVSDLVFHLPSENSIPEFFGKQSAIYKNAETAFLARTNGQKHYAFQQFGALFICLNSESHPEHRGKLDQEQLNFLKALVPEAKKYFKHVFCFIHLSAWRHKEKKTSNWFEEIHPVLIDANVKYVFGACLHTYQHEEYDGIHYITSGSCGNNLEPNFPHFLKVNVNEDLVKVTVYRKGFPLYFPMEMQLNPQLADAFINGKGKLVTADTYQLAQYKKAINLLLSGDLKSAQDIWQTLRIFPDFNPEKIASNICEPTKHGHNDWFTDIDIEEQIKARFFK